MKKSFNTKGFCIPAEHYMINIDNIINKAKQLINEERYLVINKPIKYGKTTFLNSLCQRLKDKNIVININAKSFNKESFSSRDIFCRELLKLINNSIPQYNEVISQHMNLTSMFELREFIINLTSKEDVVLVIDDSDILFNNKISLDFLGILRSLYLEREEGLVTTFKSVILVGTENHSWSIAENFGEEISFMPEDIESMLEDYNNSNNNVLTDLKELAQTIYKYTGGYPYLISRICEIIYYEVACDNKRSWSANDVQQAVDILLKEDNELLHILNERLSKDDELRKLLKGILNNEVRIFNIDNLVINKAYEMGYVIRNDSNGCAVMGNLIFKEYVMKWLNESC